MLRSKKVKIAGAVLVLGLIAVFATQVMGSDSQPKVVPDAVQIAWFEKNLEPELRVTCERATDERYSDQTSRILYYCFTKDYGYGQLFWEVTRDAHSRKLVAEVMSPSRADELGLGK
jgi:hypothetical protein